MVSIMWSSIIFLFNFFVIFVNAELDEYSCNVIYDKSARYRLKQHLFCDYDPSIRPVTPEWNKTVVQTIIKLVYAEFDEDKNQLTAHTMLTLGWKDPHLTWKPNDFEGLNKTYVKGREVWVPQMYSLNPRPEEESKLSEASCRLRNNGQIRCRMVEIFVAPCDSDYTYWPYDTHNCSIDMGAWAYSRSEVSRHGISGYYTRFYNVNPSWEIELGDISNRQLPMKYKKNYTFPVMSIEIRLSRPWTVLRKVVVTPVIIMTVLNLTVLWLRAGSVQRLILACVSFLGHMLCFSAVHWLLPKSATDPPNVVIFYVASMVLSMLALITTCWLQKLLPTKKEVPAWLHTKISPIFHSTIGQMLSANMMDPETLKILQEEDDIAVETETKRTNWNNVVTVISWITLFINVFIYIVLFLVLLR